MAIRKIISTALLGLLSLNASGPDPEKGWTRQEKGLAIRKKEPKEIEFYRDSFPKVLDSLPDDTYMAVNIDKSEQSLSLYEKRPWGWQEKYDWEASTGRYKGDKEKRGDNKTPEGIFTISKIHNSSNWLYNGERAYGPYFLRLHTGWQGIGIHGTNEPERLGKRASHGCIRLTNDNISRLKSEIDTGTYVTISKEPEYKKFIKARIEGGNYNAGRK
ncbi:MAG: L,D-transpeptidase [Nanobdellota archaeon]